MKFCGRSGKDIQANVNYFNDKKINYKNNLDFNLKKFNSEITFVVTCLFSL